MALMGLKVTGAPNLPNLLVMSQAADRLCATPGLSGADRAAILGVTAAKLLGFKS
jgi:hypothetical protein